MTTTDEPCFTVKPGELTLGELCELEELVGEPAFRALVSMSAKTIRAIVWLLARRDDPSFTFDDTAGLKVSDVDIVTEDDPAEDEPEVDG